jgi:hypothetical protein
MIARSRLPTRFFRHSADSEKASRSSRICRRAISQTQSKMSIDLPTATAADLQSLMQQGALTRRDLVDLYLERQRSITTTSKPSLQLLRSFSCIKELVFWIASALMETFEGHSMEFRFLSRFRHSILEYARSVTDSMLTHDNIATEPELGLPTTCGSLALVGSRPRKSAQVVEKVRLLKEMKSSICGARLIGVACRCGRDYTWKGKSFCKCW